MRPRLRLLILGIQVWGTLALAGCGSSSAIPSAGAASEREAGPAVSTALEPAGRISLPAPPERIVALDAQYAEILAVLGEERRLVAIGWPAFLTSPWYERVPGWRPRYVSDVDVIFGEGGRLDAERLYDLDADLHLIDPLRLTQVPGWSEADIATITRRVGPFLGNRYSRTCAPPPGVDSYRYYDLWQIAHAVARLLGKTARIDALEDLARVLEADIAARLPPPAQRPPTRACSAPAA